MHTSRASPRRVCRVGMESVVASDVAVAMAVAGEIPLLLLLLGRDIFDEFEQKILEMVMCVSKVLT